MATIPLSLDGHTDLPAGLVANVVTYLERLEPPSGPAPADPRAGFGVRRADTPAAGWYRQLFRRIGEPWLWTSVLVMPDEELAERLSDPQVEVHVLERGSDVIGLAELDFRKPGEVEVVLFGVVPEAAGTGAARHLMEVVLRRAFARDMRRVWLHTCTFDHPAAVPFYRRAGFRPYKAAIEVMPDPRLYGLLPASAAPHLALIAPESGRTG